VTAVLEPARVPQTRPTLAALRSDTDRARPLRRPPVDLEVVVPAYNEAHRLPDTVAETIAYLDAQPWTSRLVVVDNGSSDDTARVIRSLADPSARVCVDVIGCARPGKGAAVRRGLLTSESRFVGFFDADLATPVETLSTAMALLAGGTAAVVGSRYAPGAALLRRQPLGRRVGGALFRRMTHGVVAGVHDTQCGFKFFDRETVSRALAQCRTTGFAFDVELLQRIQADGGSIVEIPVAWTDDPRSTFRPIPDGIACFTALLALRRG
jgi:glycosyltransferase involved in cell wall biosynthesis